MADFKRREFLKASAAFAAAASAGGFGCVEIASAAPIQAPMVDRVSVQVLVDGAYNLFLRPGEVKGVKIERPPRESDYRRAIHNEWGLSLFVESQRAAEQRSIMLDFGYTGQIKRRTVEKVTGGARVEYAMKDGFGCNAAHFAPEEQLGKIVDDQHYHEHATCFNVKDRGLVVLSSCGHVGIVNSAKQAQEVSGVQKVHALVGGFHLGATADPQLKLVIEEIKALNPDVIIPMHCSGDNFARAVRETMPDKLIQPSTGARLTFGA